MEKFEEKTKTEDELYILYNKIFMNHLILKTIADNLSLKYHPEARLVCRLWHEIFSKDVVVKFRFTSDFMKFCLINNEKLNKKGKNEAQEDWEERERRLKNYFSKFDMTKWDRSNYSEFTFDLIIRQLTNLSTVKELTLPQLDFYQYISLFKLISPTIQVLNVDMEIPKDSRRSRYKHASVFNYNNGQPIILENVKKLIIRTENGPPREEFWDLLAICINLKELVLNDIFINFLYLLDWIENIKPSLRILSLKYLHYIDEQNLYRLIKIVQSGLLEKVRTEEFSLDKSNIYDFFHVISIYMPNELTEMSSSCFTYLDKQINSIYKVDSAISNVIPIHKLFFHFPSLKTYAYTEGQRVTPNDEHVSTSLFSLTGEVYPEMREFNFSLSASSTRPEIPAIICEIFPNLTTLSLSVSKSINLTPIFANLTKLKVFIHSSENENSIGDEDLIGQPFSFFNKMLTEINHENLNFIKVTDKPTIANLKELQVLKLIDEDVPKYSYEYRDRRDLLEEEDDRKLLSEFSLFLGLRLLPKLNHLVLKISSVYYIPRNILFDVFISEFPQLLTLDILSKIKNEESTNSYLYRLRRIRPKLKINFD